MGIIFDDVSYSYSGKKKGKFFTIKNINLEIEKENEFVIVCGQTGSGKSTLVQHMNALLLPTQGTVSIFDTKLGSKKTKKIGHLRQKVGLVFQFPEYQLFEETVLKDIIFGPINFGVPKEQAESKARQLCKKLRIDDSLLDRSPFKLSGGQMRKVAIAGILAFEPKILVMDEPTRGLDPRSRVEVMDFIHELHKELGISIVVITHDMELLSQYGTRVVVMNKGKKAYDGGKRQLFETGEYEKHGLKLPKSIEILRLIKTKFELEIDEYQFNIDDLIKELEGSLNG